MAVKLWQISKADGRWGHPCHKKRTEGMKQIFKTLKRYQKKNFLTIFVAA